MSLILTAPWRRAIRSAANAFPPATGDGGGSTAPGGFPNAPSSAGWLTVRDMTMSQLPYRRNYEADNGSGMYYYNPDDVARVSVQTTSSDPVSPPTAVRTTIPAGWTGGGGSMSRWETRGFPANDGNMYIGYTIRPSANWWHPADDVGWKNWYLRPAGGDSDSIHFLAWVDNGAHGVGTMLPKFGTQWGGAATDEAWINSTLANELVAGSWNTVEFLITPNSGGLYNGSLQVWVNGVSVAVTNGTHGSGINWFLAGQTIGWNGVWWDMIYANPSAVPPAEQYVEHGHVLIKVRQQGTGPTGVFPNAPSGGGWTALREGDPPGLPRRYQEGAYMEPNGTNMRVYTQDMYLLQNAYDYLTYTGGAATPWSSSGAYLSIRFPPSHPGGYTTVKVHPDPAGTGLLGITPAEAPTGEIYRGVYMRFRGSNGYPYTNSGNQQKLEYFSSTDAGSSIIHIIIGDDRNDGVGDLSLVTQFNPPAGGIFNNIRRGISADMGDGLWHLVEYRLKRNTYTAGTGNAQVSGTDLVFTNSQTGVVSAGTYITINQSSFRVVSMSSATNGIVTPSFSGTTGALPFDIVNQNGEFQLWLDGVQRASHTDVVLFLHSGGDNAVPDFFSLEPIYGGGSNPSPSTHSLYVDYGRMKMMGR